MAPGSEHPAVLVEGLVKKYPGGVLGVSGLSFRVERGEVYGLIGPNGSGKTTTLRIIATILKPSAGRVMVYGVDVAREPLRARRLLSYLPEEAGAYRDLRGIDYLRFIAELRAETRREAEEIVEEAARLAGLGKALYRPVKTYSKGMKRLLALSAALAVKPSLAVLDEPTAGLDVERSLEIRRTIRKYNEDYGVTVLLSSHNMLEVEHLCSRVGIIYRGRLVAEGAPQELMERYGARSLEEVFLAATRGEGEGE